MMARIHYRLRYVLRIFCRLDNKIHYEPPPINPPRGRGHLLHFATLTVLHVEFPRQLIPIGTIPTAQRLKKTTKTNSFTK